jgi:ribosome biogenesis GTPase A
MPIHWFPGHMHATKKAISKRLPDIDVVIELLDARLPGSSSNPLMAELAAAAGGKPTLKVLNKQDLADPDITAQWLAHFQAQPNTNAIALNASTNAASSAPSSAPSTASSCATPRQLIQASRDLVPLRGGMVKPVRVLICGIPNVGKSTLINTLVSQRMAKTGDEPGITKVEQKIALANDFLLVDTPGMLWPRISVEESGYHLAASGGIGRNAYDEEEVALALLARVRGRYADRLKARYKLDDFSSRSDEALLADVGRKRGGLLAGGQVNLQKAAEITINDFRTGAWGRISLETPEEFARWQVAAAAQEANRLAKLAERSKKKPQADGSRDTRADVQAVADTTAQADAATGAESDLTGDK